jgi:ABC-2 type transport system permease protein
MNSPSNTMPESFDSERAAPAAIAPTQPLYWSVKRELWENRYVYIVPLVVAAVTVFGFLIATIGRAMSTPDLAHRLAVLEEPYHFATALIMGATFVVGFFYCLEALHGERRDRSILFWKSLPVSDLITVLSKACIPLVILPVLTMVIVVAAEGTMLLLSSLVVLGSGLSVLTLWTTLALPHMWMTLLYHTVTVHVLWYLPIYAWLLLVSGWARRATFLWAALPAVAISVLEKVAFNTWHFAFWLQYRFSGPEHFDLPGRGEPMMHLNLGTFLSTPGLWFGLIVAAIFLAVAVRLRRYQGPI